MLINMATVISRKGMRLFGNGTNTEAFVCKIGISLLNYSMFVGVEVKLKPRKAFPN